LEDNAAAVRVSATGTRRSQERPGRVGDKPGQWVAPVSTTRKVPQHGLGPSGLIGIGRRQLEDNATAVPLAREDAATEGRSIKRARRSGDKSSQGNATVVTPREAPEDGLGDLSTSWADCANAHEGGGSESQHEALDLCNAP